ncbi:hypothetical protein JK364_00735 [Streptomyces sp. 110]|uniref:HEAT repeat domain-containing protein n=1 Tax=Streptomyces endocoffeicus TaxID=2898945 RepID=A0ABS1PEZ8_9ACTN|nr:hypothetical protein [Streptomyces endocoffeicus]MBL1110945.1 hypothetical protein [Streptomyces endocoffeicus]
MRRLPQPAAFYHAEAADAPLITAALRAVNGDVVDDGAVSAAGQCLYACDVPEDRELVAQLGAMALDEDRPLRVRVACARALASAESDQAAERAVRLTDLAELELQMAGAVGTQWWRPAHLADHGRVGAGIPALRAGCVHTWALLFGDDRGGLW